MSMTNAEKFKEDWGFEPNVTHCPKIGRESCMVCPYAGKCFEECASDWWNSEYQGKPTIPLGEPELSSGFELGYEHGKADNNDKWLEWIEELESEIEGESQVEEIFDEDSFNSMNNENNLPEVAECESYIETDIIPLHKLFAIIERKLKEVGVNHDKG